VIDNHLPDGTGIDLCRTLTAQTPSVRLLIHSGTISDAE
jgi:response regulator of citrate/malate metabolism